jgi:hypothetical protein
MAREYLPTERSPEPEEVEALKLNDVLAKSHVGGLDKSIERNAVSCTSAEF